METKLTICLNRIVNTDVEHDASASLSIGVGTLSGLTVETGIPASVTQQVPSRARQTQKNFYNSYDGMLVCAIKAI